MVFPWAKLKGQFIMQIKVETEGKNFSVQSLKLYLTLYSPMDCSMPGFQVLHYLLEFAHTCVHWVGDAIQPPHPLSPPSSAFNLSQPLGSFPMSRCFPSGGQSVGVSASVSVLPMNIQGWFTLGLRSKNYAFFALMKYFLFLNINYIWHKLIW